MSFISLPNSFFESRTDLGVVFASSDVSSPSSSVVVAIDSLRRFCDASSASRASSALRSFCKVDNDEGERFDATWTYQVLRRAVDL